MVDKRSSHKKEVNPWVRDGAAEVRRMVSPWHADVIRLWQRQNGFSNPDKALEQILELAHTHLRRRAILDARGARCPEDYREP